MTTIINSIAFAPSEEHSNEGSVNSVRSTAKSETSAYQIGHTTSETTFLQEREFLYNYESGKFFQTGDLEASLSININTLLFETSHTIVPFDKDLYDSVFLQTVVGDVYPHSNPIIDYVYINLTDPFREAINSSSFIVTEERITQVGSLNVTEVETLLGSGILEQIDVFGPRLENILPVSGSTYNNPISNISFDLKDQEKTEIIAGSINFYINDIQVISGSIDVTPSWFGSTFLTYINEYYYQFLFIPTSQFDLGSSVVVSGSAEDNYVSSGNVSNFLYNFGVWDYSSLGAMITGLPDVQSPFLQNLIPLPNEVEVDISNNIELEIVDIHTGVDQDTVILSLDDIVVYSGLTELNPLFASVTSSVTSSGKGRSYIIDPVLDLDMNRWFTVGVYAKDLYIPSPNVLDVSYNFRTLNNYHLLASGLEIYVDSSYQDLYIDESLPTTTTGTDFKVTYHNLNNLGINTSGSYISYNEVIISGAYFVSVSGNDIYDIYFSLVPDYTTNCILKFHVEQDTLISGATVWREFSTELLWGAEYCYDPIENFSYGKKVPITVQVFDSGDWNGETTLSYKFDTLPYPKHDLYAQIVGIDPPHADFIANLESNNPYFEYGKNMNLTIEAEDYAGNKLEYKWDFTIEDNPN